MDLVPVDQVHAGRCGCVAFVLRSVVARVGLPMVPPDARTRSARAQSGYHRPTREHATVPRPLGGRRGLALRVGSSTLEFEADELLVALYPGIVTGCDAVSITR